MRVMIIYIFRYFIFMKKMRLHILEPEFQQDFICRPNNLILYYLIYIIFICP